MKVVRLWCTLAVAVGFVSAAHGADFLDVPIDGKAPSSKEPSCDVAVFRALRPPESVRTFRSEAVDAKIASVAAKIKNKT